MRVFGKIIKTSRGYHGTMEISENTVIIRKKKDKREGTGNESQ